MRLELSDLGEGVVHELDGDGTFTHGGRDPLQVPETYICDAIQSMPVASVQGALSGETGGIARRNPAANISLFYPWCRIQDTVVVAVPNNG